MDRLPPAVPATDDLAAGLRQRIFLLVQQQASDVVSKTMKKPRFSSCTSRNKVREAELIAAHTSSSSREKNCSSIPG
jgi:hypothetical protein